MIREHSYVSYKDDKTATFSVAESSGSTALYSQPESNTTTTVAASILFEYRKNITAIRCRFMAGTPVAGPIRIDTIPPLLGFFMPSQPSDSGAPCAGPTQRLYRAAAVDRGITYGQSNEVGSH